MNRQLRERRDRAAERHDAALSQYPTRAGTGFEREMRAVVDELTAVTELADPSKADPGELAKAYCWLGDAYFDLGRGTDEAQLTCGAQAYQHAEQLLAETEAPVQRAKLDFNCGNTLRGLSQGSDVALLEAAEARYESAAEVFRAHHLPNLAAIVTEQIHTIGPQLRLARKHAELKQGMSHLEKSAQDLQGADVVKRERIARELAGLKKRRERGNLGETLQEALGVVQEQTQRHPERFSGAAEKVSALEGQIEALQGVLAAASPEHPSSGGTPDGADQSITRALAERLRKEAAEGNVSAGRAAQLGAILKEFSDVMSETSDDVGSMAARAQKMRELTKQLRDMAMSPSWSTPEPAKGSRPQRATAILQPLKRYLLAEKGRGMLPSEEASAGTDLLTHLVKLEARLREAASDESDVTDLEDQTWRLALNAQAHARRYHLMLAKPDFAMVETHAQARSLFVSGGQALRTAVKQLAARDDLVLYERAQHGEHAQERWNQLWSASVAVFDVGVRKGAALAEICYELGLALALGKPLVVAAKARRKPPFDVNVRPIHRSGECDSDTDTLGRAVEEALSTIIWGGGEAGLGAGTDDALRWLDERFHDRLSDSMLSVARRLAEGNREDAIAFRRSLEQLLGMLGADAPAILLPAWPPAYPDPTKKPRCFHVMPFSEDWSDRAREIAREVCTKRGWHYSRGDEADEQRIIRAIWKEIGRASAVLVDITGHNANVALELGLVRALGRHYRVITQDAVSKPRFKSIEKVQIHRYGGGPDYSGFASEVEGLLDTADHGPDK